MIGATGIPQRVLIVGGSSEIGGALARAWLKRGTRDFVVTERAAGAADTLVGDLVAGGARVDRVVLDALDRGVISPAIDSAWAHGDVDVVVIAIGLLGSQTEIDEDPTRVWDLLTVNATASIQIALEAVKRMGDQEYGSIVLLSSVAGQRGRSDNYVYGASKAALDTFAEGLQQRLGGSAIRVLVARPGYVFSKMSAGVDPAPFAVSVEYSRDEILRALDRGKDVIWIPSVLGVIFFGFRMLPRRLWAAIVSKTR